MLITDEILKMAHINGLYGSQRIHQLNGNTKKVIEIQRQIEKESEEWHKMRKKDNLKEIIIKSKNLEQDLIEKGYKEDDIAFFITMDIQREMISFVSDVLEAQVKRCGKFMGHTLYTIEGKETIYIGVKI